MHIVRCAMYTVQCTVYTAHCFILFYTLCPVSTDKVYENNIKSYYPRENLTTDVTILLPM